VIHQPRIVILNDSSTAGGGATGLALLAARLLSERGRDVVFVCGDLGDDPSLDDLDVEIVAFGGRRLLEGSRGRTLLDGIWNRKAAAFLSRWIDDHGRPDDVWHIHGWSQIWSPAIFSALQPVWDRLVVHAHDYFSACPNGTFWNFQTSSACALKPLSAACLTSNCDKRSRAQKIWRLARHSALRDTFRGGQAPLLLLIHPGMAPPLERAGVPPSKMRVLRNPIQPLLAQPGRPEANGALMFVGRLQEEKGVRQLAEAAGLAGVAMTFVGAGDLEDEILRINPRAIVTGWQDRAGLSDYAKRARALVMPSLHSEPYGMVAVEAMASGLPVALSSSALLAPEIVAAGAGWEFEPTDVQALANVLKSVADLPPTELSAMATRAVTASGELGTTLDQWCDSLESTYQSFAGGRA
jgi:glycosyltransferase involved in cell wall biosynthesis